MSISSVGSTFTHPTTTSPLVRRQTGTGATGASAEHGGNGAAVSTENPNAASSGAHVEATTSSSLPDTSRDTSKNENPEGELTEEEKKEVNKLEKRDAEVRAHEQAHLAAAGPHAVSGANFQYETGPDGNRYAVGGDVSISVSEEQTPEATIAKMQVIVRAAMAPAEPSAQDHRVAAEASQKAAAARRELSGENGDAASASAPPDETGTDASPETGSILPAKAEGAGFEAIAQQARSTGAQKAYDSIAPANPTMDWTA